MGIPSQVLDAYGFTANNVETVAGGLINETYCVKGDDGESVAAVQRLHQIFGADVNHDIEAITDVLAKAHMVTPRLWRTKSGEVSIALDGYVWRSITWIDGQCFSRLPNLQVARAGAELVGRFHRALDGLDYSFKSTRSGVHDTEAHFEKLRRANEQKFSEESLALNLREQIFAQADSLPKMPVLPTRICHGDLKLSNLLFDEDERGLCLIDLDTLGQQTIAYELGDALRSWANLSGEDLATPEIDADVVREAALGYAEGSHGLLSQAEIASVIIGLETICLELAARFCVDIFDDSYFGWDNSRFASRRAHNVVRASGQLALCKSVASRREELQSLWSQAF